jgi:molybdate transport system substrate-binding protein
VRYRFSLAVAFALLLSVSPRAHAQGEVTFLVANPARRTIAKLVPKFESKTGYKLVVTNGGGMGTRQQIARGELFDVSILLPPYPEALASGNIDPKSETPLAGLVLSLGVKKGAPKPDISTVEALKKTLLAAKAIAVVDPKIGSDGFATREALEKLGVLDALGPKLKLARTASATRELVTKGEADLTIHYRNEMDTPEIDIVGPLPQQFAPPTKIVAFISTHAKNASGAKALVEYLASPEADAIYEQDGMIPER